MAQLLEEKIYLREKKERPSGGVELRVSFVVKFANYERDTNFSAEFELFAVDYKNNIPQSRRWKEHKLPPIKQQLTKIDDDNHKFVAITINHSDGENVQGFPDNFKRFRTEWTFFPYDIVNEDPEDIFDELIVDVIIDPKIAKGDRQISTKILKLSNVG